MNSVQPDRPTSAHMSVGVISVTGALVTGVFGWLGSFATMFAHPPVEAAVFLAAAALAFGLAAMATLRV